jgi:hypothetical protein
MFVEGEGCLLWVAQSNTSTSSPATKNQQPTTSKDLPYFLSVAGLSVYIGSHRAVTSVVRQQITIKEVRV